MSKRELERITFYLAALERFAAYGTNAAASRLMQELTQQGTFQAELADLHFALLDEIAVQ